MLRTPMMLYVDVKGLWSIQLDMGERQHMSNDAVCRCKGSMDYTVRLGREATHAAVMDVRI